MFTNLMLSPTERNNITGIYLLRLTSPGVAWFPSSEKELALVVLLAYNTQTQHFVYKWYTPFNRHRDSRRDDRAHRGANSAVDGRIISPPLTLRGPHPTRKFPDLRRFDSDPNCRYTFILSAVGTATIWLSLNPSYLSGSIFRYGWFLRSRKLLKFKLIF